MVLHEVDGKWMHTKNAWWTQWYCLHRNLICRHIYWHTHPWIKSIYNQTIFFIYFLFFECHVYNHYNVWKREEQISKWLVLIQLVLCRHYIMHIWLPLCVLSSENHKTRPNPFSGNKEERWPEYNKETQPPGVAIINDIARTTCLLWLCNERVCKDRDIVKIDILWDMVIEQWPR